MTVDVDKEIPEPQSAKEKGSFAYRTLKDRMPQILTKTIDSLHRRNGEIKAKHGTAGLDELNSAIGMMSQLRYEIMTNKPLKPLSEKIDSSAADPIWSSWLKNLPADYLWFSSPWLEVECFMYRLVYEGFRSHPLVKDIDPFGEAKLDNLTASSKAVDNLLSWYEQTMLCEGAHSSKQDDFDLLLQLSLWGNRCDLSLSGGSQSSAQSHLMPDEEVKHLRKHLLVDESRPIWDWLLSKKHNFPKRIDIVLDNSGYELINDLVFADWLIHQRDSNGAFMFSPVVLHCKDFPWFVSDTTCADFEFTLQWLADRPESKNLAQRLRALIQEGRLKIETHSFWTTPYHFWLIKDHAPDLLAQLCTSHLVIFKGDLNGRKMFADLKWKPTATFEEAVSPLAKLLGSYENGKTAICLARTLKCEVGFGLSAQVASELCANSPDWAYSGQYGEIQAMVPKS